MAPKLADSGSLSDLRTPSLIAVMSASVSLTGLCALREEEAGAAAAAAGLGSLGVAAAGLGATAACVDATAACEGATAVGIGSTSVGVAATLPVMEGSLVAQP